MKLENTISPKPRAKKVLPSRFKFYMKILTDFRTFDIS